MHSNDSDTKQNALGADTPDDLNASGASQQNLPQNTPPAKVVDKRTMTLRVRKETREFFDTVDVVLDKLKEVNEDATQADASAKLIASLTEASKENEKLLEQLNSLEEQLRIAQETTLQIGQKQPEPDSLDILSDEEKRLFMYIAERRFRDEETRKRYKLQQPETIAQLLKNCILSKGILYNANGDFFTGFTGKTS